MTWNVRHAALVWAALAASGAASLSGCGQSNCSEKAVCPDGTADGGEAGSPLDATTGGDALVGLDGHIEAAGEGSVTDASATDAADAGGGQCGTLGLACCADAGCGGGLACGDAGACACPAASKLCDATCIPSASCCTNTDCTGGQTCQSGTCACPQGQTLCNGTCQATSGCCTNSDCGTGGQCTGGTCGCQTGYRLCGTSCIPSGDCCSAGDCMTSTTNTCSGGTCTCNGSIACAGGQECTAAGCACPGGDKLCGSACIPVANCCTDNDCTSPPDVCHGSPGTCSGGGCTYTPYAPVPVKSCAPPATGQTLDGNPVSGICIDAVYYCSASEVPFGQTTPSGYANEQSNPGGCDYNGCSDAGMDNCHENFCADALGNCASCP
jgi:hypothetical protein